MLLTKDSDKESTNRIIDLNRNPDWFNWWIGGLIIAQDESYTEVKRGVVLSDFIKSLEEKPSAEISASGTFIIGQKSSEQEGLLYIYGVPKNEWSAKQTGFVTGTTIVGGMAEPGTVTFLSLGNDMISIGYPVHSVDFKIELPERLEKRLESISSLEENWDSYSADRISSQAIKKARSLLIEAGLRCGKALMSSAFIAPCSDGGIQLEWTSESEIELIVKILPSLKNVEFLLTDPSMEGKEGTIKEMDDWDKLLNEFCNLKK